MNRKLSFVCLILLLSALACKKPPADVPAPVAPPAQPTEEQPAEPVVEDAKPDVHVNTPDEVDTFDPSRFNLDDVYFDFDKSDLRADTREALNRYSQVLRANPEIQVLIEGHCDERGTEEYNLGLGERRANRVRDYMVSLGISASRLKTISYGEMDPKNPGHNEEAWAQNRRAHFTLSR